MRAEGHVLTPCRTVFGTACAAKGLLASTTAASYLDGLLAPAPPA